MSTARTCQNGCQGKCTVGSTSRGNNDMAALVLFILKLPNVVAKVFDLASLLDSLVLFAM